MRNLFLIFALCGGAASAEDLKLRQELQPKLWKASVTALAVSNALDIHSSWGKHELNGALAGDSGTFGSRGALLKLGFQGGLIGLEYLISRGHPSKKVFRVLTIVNFGAAGMVGGVAAHNYTIPRPH